MIGLIANKDVIGYITMPRFRARLENLFMTGFEFIAYFMALVYSAVNLLPANHPYTLIENKGKFGIRHVIAEAANNLKFKKENIDQIILFAAMLIGIVLIFVQIVMLGVAMFMQPVFAAMPTNFAEFFLTPLATERTDIAHIMMDLVFGVGDGAGNNLFNSCIAQQVTCTETLPAGSTPAIRNVMVDSGGYLGIGGTSIFAPLGFPFPIHLAMHQMFQLYNTGLLVVAAFISLYFMATVVAETAQTGTAFGKRFNKVWAPLRIVFAFGLLVPVGLGFNASQWIVLYAAKFGSGFATNGWNYFNTTITDGFFGDQKDLVSAPNIPEIKALVQFLYTARTCYHLHENYWNVHPQHRVEATNWGMFLVKGTGPTAAAGNNYEEVQSAAGTPYTSLINFAAGSGTIKIRFGIQDDAHYWHVGSVSPTCGEITFKLTDSRTPAGVQEPGLRSIQDYYWTFIKTLWFGAIDAESYPENTAFRYAPWNRDEDALMPDSNFRSNFLDSTRDLLEDAIITAVTLMEQSDRYTVNNLVTEKGWAGAAIWYNRIAEMNGAVTSATLNIPYPSLYPKAMEDIQREKKLRNNNVSFEMRFHPQIRDADPIKFREDKDSQMANALWIAYSFWQTGEGGASPHASSTGNAMIDSINALFGTEGLYNIRRNPDTHPLAQLVGIGRGLVEAAIRNLTLSVVGGVGSSLLKVFEETTGAAGQVLSTFLITVTMVGLTAGFILFYVVPFLPFIYFFFAVGGWIKGIFEAMVGAPLWALAHIRIDQNGLPGQAGVAGYFLIFEIFLRPILIIFGMLASVSIFSALVSVLNQIFDLVTTNLAGFDFRSNEEGQAPTINGGNVVIQDTLNTARGAIDEFFFTVIYTIIIYLMAMSSFKLIDLIPNNILRWMGQSTATFNDQREDAAQGLVGKATIGSQQTNSALGNGLKKLTGGG